MQSAGTVFVCFLFCLVLLLGGGTTQGSVQEAFLELMFLPLLGYMIVALLRGRGTGARRVALVLAGSVVLVPIMQLVPMPPALWSHLPHRSMFADAFRAEHMPLPWLPISLSPAITWRSLFSLIPPIAVFLAATWLNVGVRRWLTFSLIVVAFLSVLLGFAQVAAGSGSPLRLYAITNPDQAVGFFANRNHFSALLYATLPFLGAWSLWAVRARRRSVLVIAGLCLTVYLIFMLGIALAASKTGLVLAVLATLLVVFLAASGRKHVQKTHPAVIAGGAAVLFSAVLLALFALGLIANNRISNGTAEGRIPIARATLSAAQTFAPVGSGVGTFVPIYLMFEHKHDMTSEYINRAHDDWLESALETGVAGPLIGLLLLVFVAVRGVSIWNASGPPGVFPDPLLERAATLSIVLLALHSFVDYPLRTTAMTCVLALAFAWVAAAPSARKPATPHDRVSL